MPQTLTKDEIDQQAEIFAEKLLTLENAEYIALSILDAVKANTPVTIAQTMVCQFGFEHAEKVAERMVKLVKARTKDG